MKKYIHLFLLSAFFLSLAPITGCKDDCKGKGCPEDAVLPVEMEEKVPYQAGQKIRFVNPAGDTIALECTHRSYLQQKVNLYDTDSAYKDCCPSFVTDNIKCELYGNNGNFLKIHTDYVGQHLIRISATLNGIDYNNGGLRKENNTLRDSIQLNGKTFYNVSTAENGKEGEIYMFLGLDGQGIVGFIINGEEWCLLE